MNESELRWMGHRAKGLSNIAFLKALKELKVRPAVIAGNSIGAFIGSVYAAGVKKGVN